MGLLRIHLRAEVQGSQRHLSLGSLILIRQELAGQSLNQKAAAKQLQQVILSMSPQHRVLRVEKLEEKVKQKGETNPIQEDVIFL